MDLSDLFNLLIVGGVIFGPMLAKMKMAKNANKAKGLGTSGPIDAGTGLRRTPIRPAAAGTGVQRPIPRRPIEPTAKQRRKIVPAAPTVKAAKPAKARPAPPAPPVSVASVCPQPRRNRWTRLQEAVVLREMLDRPVALRESGN